MEQLSQTRPDEGQIGWGPRLLDDNLVAFSVWAPDAPDIKLVTGFADLPMDRSPDGWHSLTVSGIRPGDRYSLRLPDSRTVPDPAARAQADDVHGASVLVDHAAYDWKNGDFRGRPWEETIILEIHVGTFTPEGTFRAAIAKLPEIREAGITAIELMPVAQFRGNRGWGYDGVLHYAPHAAYGTPDDLKALVDAAHGLGMMVFLDVVYNHFGPEGNHLHAYATSFFRSDDPTPWGASIDFHNPAVRRYFADNAAMWLGDYRLDGLRFDATEQIRDESEVHFLVELTADLRKRFADRHVHLIAEDQRGLRSLLARGDDGSPSIFTATWSDSLHHCLHVLTTGEAKGYYARFSEDLWTYLLRALTEGFVFPHEESGPAAAVPPNAYVNYLQNHDQIGNRAFGDRLNTLLQPDLMEVLTAMMMLIPHTPMLFQGEDFNDTSPFCFFADFEGDLAEAMRKGRVMEAENFGGMPAGKTRADLPDPMAMETFDRSKIDWSRAETDEGRKARLRLRALADARQRHLAPLLAAGKGVATCHVHPLDEGLIAIDWTFATGKLCLRANLTGGTAPMPEVEGEIIFAQTAAGSVHGALPSDMPGPGIVVSVRRA